MNCRFCGNFVPEGADSCPVCGRRPEEDPIGKLLSENRPGMDSEAEEDKKEAKDKPKSLAGSIIAIIAGIAIWIYGYSVGVLGNMQALLFKGIENAQMTNNQYIIIGLVVLGTVIGIVGIISLIAKLISNSK